MTRVEVTYAEVGATRRDDLSTNPPAGFRPLVREVRLGTGEELWRWASPQPRLLGIQRRSGMAVVRRPGLADGSRPVEEGDTLRLRIGVIPIPARVVYVVDETTRQGFAYGTLPGHPECGEEAFVVERRGDEVWLTIRAFSRPAHPLLWLGYPVLRAFQEIYTRRYLRALAQH